MPEDLPLVVIESPWRGKNPVNRIYMLRCILDSVMRRETPYASHRMLTEVLDDNCPKQRQLGIRCGLAVHSRAETIAFYVDQGWSEGMEGAERIIVSHNVS